MIEQIFDSENIKVGIYEPVLSGGILLITFSPLIGERAKLNPNSWNGIRDGFAQNFCIKHKINSIFIVATHNHWWETQDSNRAIKIIKKLPIYNNASKIILYGSSMGGYGTILFCNKLQASSIISVVPQIFVDFERGFFDSRWLRFREKIKFIFNNAKEELLKYKGKSYFIYDPYFESDMAHIAMVREIGTIKKIEIEFGAHTPLVALKSAKNLEKLLFAIFEDDEKRIDDIVLNTRKIFAKRGWEGFDNIKSILGKSDAKEIFLELSSFFKDEDENLSLHLYEFSQKVIK